MKKIISVILIIATALMAFSVTSAGLPSVIAENVAIELNDIKSGNQTVTVKLSIENNPGIIGLIIDVQYESEYFTLTSVNTQGVMSKASFDSKTISKASPAKNPYRLAWSGDTLPKNIKDNGTLATLTFTVDKDTPAGVYAISVSYDYENYGIVNYKLENVKFEMVNGSITVGENPVAATYPPSVSATSTPNATATPKATTTPQDANYIDDSGLEDEIIIDDGIIYSDEETSVKLENLVISGMSLDIEKGLSAKFKVSKSLFEGENCYEEPYMSFSFCDIRTIVKEYDVVGNYYIFEYDGITPEKMNKDLNATVYATSDGVLVSSKTVKYSIKKYCYNMLESHSDDTKICSLIVDVLNYGASCQIYSDYETDNLVNGDLTDEQKAFATESIPEVNDVLNTEIKFCDNAETSILGAGIVLKNQLYLRFLIKNDNPNGLTAEVEFDGNKITIDKVTKCDSGYYFYYPVDMDKLDKEISVTVMYKNEANSNTVKYSVMSYVSAMLNSEDSKLTNVLNYLLKYYLSANEYLK